MESAAELIVHPALGHFAQRQERHVERFGILRAGVVAQQEVEDGGPRELGRAAEAAALGIERAPEDREAAVQQPLVYGRRAGARRREARILRELLYGVAGRVHYPAAIGRPRRGDLRQDGSETGMAVARLRREVRAAEKRLQAGGQPHRHRPAAAAGGGLHERHVDVVHVGALFAIHFDGHVVAVQQLRDTLVLEGLPFHDVVPVAGGVADGKKDGLVLAARLIERLGAPGIPVHRVVGVLQQVRTLFVGKPVRAHRDPVRSRDVPGRSRDR